MSTKQPLRLLIMKEAMARQGTVVRCQRGTSTLQLEVKGGANAAEFAPGGEGLVHHVTEVTSRTTLRLKCFWDPNALRQERSKILSEAQLADPRKSVADALGGAPLVLVEGLGGYTQFGLLMKDIGGESWSRWLERVGNLDANDRRAWWPKPEVCLTWAYGLAYAVSEMEKRGFIHADFSPGNVMLTGAGEHAGDMALVDFDGFVYPQRNVNETHLRGTEGFSAPEIWDRQPPEVGSDRVGMAILIQQFLVAGDAKIETYDQVDDLCNRRGRSHPAFRTRYQRLAELLNATLAAEKPQNRPAPGEWCQELWSLYQAATGEPIRITVPEANSLFLAGVTLRSEGAKNDVVVTIADSPTSVDLGPSFGIRASIVRGPNLAMTLRVGQGASLRIKDTAGKWHLLESSTEFPVAPGILISDPEMGRSNARLSGIWKPMQLGASA